MVVMVVMDSGTPLATPKSTRRQHVARASRWVGLVVCILLSITWWFSTRWTVNWKLSPTRSIALSRSAFVVKLTDVALMRRLNYPAHFFSDENGVSSYRNLGTNEFKIWFPDYYASGIPPISQGIAIPIWMVLACVAIPTGLLWNSEIRRVRRRAMRGRCKACGYDLAGLKAKATCPECGVEHGSSRGT